MSPNIGDVLPPIRTLPLPDEAQALFSRAVEIVRQRPKEFAAVAVWLDQHYSEQAMRRLCEQTHRQGFAKRCWLLRQQSATYGRRLAIQQGRPLEELRLQRIEEARLRGQRLKNGRVVTRSHSGAEADEILSIRD